MPHYSTLFACAALLVGNTYGVTAASCPTVDLGSAASYAMLSGTTLSIINPSTVSGDISAQSMDNMPSGRPFGITQIGNPLNGTSYSDAIADMTAARVQINGLTCTPGTAHNFPGAQDLSLLDQPLVPGVFCGAGAMSIGTGGVRLNGLGTYVFRMEGALTSVSSSAVSVEGGAREGDVFFSADSVTLGSSATMIGTVLAYGSATIGANGIFNARLLAGGAIITNGETVMDISDAEAASEGCSDEVTDECASSPCRNGASCANGDSKFTCSCTAGYKGTTCSSDVNECATENGGCDSMAVCTNTIGSCSCACPAGAGFIGSGVGRVGCQCAAGKFTNTVATPDACASCPVGHYTNAATSTKTNCFKCAAGKFQANTGKTVCAKCPVGKYQPFSGKSACKSCASAMVAGATTC